MDDIEGLLQDCYFQCISSGDTAVWVMHYVNEVHIYTRGAMHVSTVCYFICQLFLSGLPYDVTLEQALAVEEVRERIEQSVQCLQAATDKFLIAILAAIENIPYGMRYMAKVLRDALHEKFPDALEKDVLKVCWDFNTLRPQQNVLKFYISKYTYILTESVLIQIP